MADPSRVRISGVLQPFAVGFAAELARQGYTPCSLQTQLHLMAHVSRWLHAKDLDIADLPAQTQPFLQARQEAGYKQHLTGKALRPLLTYLRVGRPQFSWTRIRGESDVTRRWGYGSVEAGEGSWVGADGASPEGDRSRRRRGGDGVGGLGAEATVEREPETGRGVAAAAWRVARCGLA